MRAAVSLLLVPVVFAVVGAGMVRPACAQQAFAPGYAPALVRGTVVDGSGALVPRVTVTATNAETGVTRAALAGPEGTFVIPLLQPGRYTISARRSGFATVEVRDIVLRQADQVLVRIRLDIAPLHQSIIVSAERDLLGRALVTTAALPGVSSTTLFTTFSAERLAVLPNSRSFADAIETAAAINNRSAFGAGGNVESYDVFAWGAATNSYQLNGLPVNSLEYGSSWITPDYETIEEIQVVGPGAGAEHANFTGASINLITKAGTGDFRGGGSVWYTGRGLLGDNSRGIPDYLPDLTKYRVELSSYAGGPAVTDRVLFFGGIGQTLSSTAPHRDPTADPGVPDFFDSLRRTPYQVRVDVIPATPHRLSAMYNAEPVANRNLGLVPGAGPEIGYWRDWTSNVGLLTWQAAWNGRTVSEVRFGNVSGHQYRVPNAPEDVPAVTDQRRGERQYGSAGFRRDQENARKQLLASVTHYTDNFLKTRHEAKGGIEYERATAVTDFRTSGDAMFFLYPYTGGATYVWALTGYNQHQSTRVERFSAYAQDKVTPTARSTVSAGIRYDGPAFIDGNTGRTLMSFNNLAVRAGGSYDLSGDGRAVLRAAYGRYYEKIPSYGPGYYAGTGSTPVSFYRLVTQGPIDPTDSTALRALVIRPDNLALIFTTASKPVDPEMGNPKTDALNVGLEKHIGSGLGMSLTYLYKRSDDYISLGTVGDLQFEPYTYAHPFNDRTLVLYNWVNPGIERDNHLTNLEYFYQRNHLAIAEVRGRVHPRVDITTSLTWERSTGTRENNECGVLSLCTNGLDQDPNYVANPFHNGLLLANRTWQFKLSGTARLPGGVTTSWDYRALSGHPWGATDRSYAVPGFNDTTYYSEVRLEAKDARRQAPVALLNLRAARQFALGRVRATALLDLLNAFNSASPYGTQYRQNIQDRFTYTLDANGEAAGAFGRPERIQRPREARFGLRLTF